MSQEAPLLPKPSPVLLDPPPDDGALPSSPVLVSVTPSLPLAPSKPSLKLDLACGQRPHPGFEGVDLHAPQATHKIDLMKFPWPFADNSCAELHCSHFVEHLPARDVEERDMTTETMARGLHAGDVWPNYIGKDFFFAFFDECYRTLAPDAWITVVCPAMPTDRAFQDPTHRRFLVEATFLYLNQGWRAGQGLDHYRVDCDFEAQVMWTHDSTLNTLHPEAFQRRMRELWNQRVDWVVKLRAYKPKRIIVKDVQGGAIAGPAHATRFVRCDDGAVGAPWPHPCQYVFEVAGQEVGVPGLWPPATVLS